MLLNFAPLHQGSQNQGIVTFAHTIFSMFAGFLQWGVFYMRTFNSADLAWKGENNLNLFGNVILWRKTWCISLSIACRKNTEWYIIVGVIQLHFRTFISTKTTRGKRKLTLFLVVLVICSSIMPILLVWIVDKLVFIEQSYWSNF